MVPRGARTQRMRQRKWADLLRTVGKSTCRLLQMTWWVELGAPENISFFNFSKGRTLMYVSEDVNNNVRMATKNNNENANVLNRSVI